MTKHKNKIYIIAGRNIMKGKKNWHNESPDPYFILLLLYVGILYYCIYMCRAYVFYIEHLCAVTYKSSFLCDCIYKQNIPNKCI